MQNTHISTNRRQHWQDILEAIFRLGRRKLFLSLLVSALGSAYTWLVYEPRGGPLRLVDHLVVIVGAVIVPLYLLAALAYTIVRTQPPARYLRLNRYVLLLIPAFFVGVILHNLIYGAYYPYYLQQYGDEAVFFFATVLGIPIYFVLLLLNTARHAFKRG